MRRRRAIRIAIVLAAIVLVPTFVPLAWLAVRPPVGSAFMLISRSEDPASGRECERVDYRYVDLEFISPHLSRAIVLAEDQRFFEHDGFDVRAIEQALRARAETGRLRGASTLTQQLAKNLFLWPGRSWLRKGVEAWYTGWMELAWSKRRILELYLNVAQFAPCVFGAEAAAARIFGVPASALTREQAALLAAVLPNPFQLRAHDPGPYARGRADEILALMRDAPRLPRLAAP